MFPIQTSNQIKALLNDVDQYDGINPNQNVAIVSWTCAHKVMSQIKCYGPLTGWQLVS